MSANSKSIILQELEVIENFLEESPKHEIVESANYIFERIKLNLSKMQNTDDEFLAQRFLSVASRVKYLLDNVSSQSSELLENISFEHAQWRNKQQTFYKEIDFADIELYEEDILEDVEIYLSGNIDGTNYSKSEMSHKDRAFINGIIRKTKPKTIVEIGISAGASSCIILNAIRDIDSAKLYSFDYNTNWYRDGACDKGRKTGFLVNQIIPDLISKWVLYTGGTPCRYYYKLPEDGVDVCFIDTAHFNPGEHLNILEILPFMKKNGIIIYHDTSYHSMINSSGFTNSVSLNTLKGKRIFLKSEHTAGLPNSGAIILDEDTGNILFPLFSNLSLPWSYKISNNDFIEIFNHFLKYYSPELVRIYVYYFYFYMNGGLQNKVSAQKAAEIEATRFWIKVKLKSVKFVHFHYNDKFVNPFIKFMDKYFYKNEHLHLVFRYTHEGYTKQAFPTGENVVELLYEALEPNDFADKKLIFHSLFVNQNLSLLYYNQNLLKNSAWLIWGGDMYGRGKLDDEKVLFVKRNFPKYYISSPSEVLAFKKEFGEVNGEFIFGKSYYGYNTELWDLAKSQVVNKDFVLIQINNSCSSENFEMLEILSKYKDENIKIRCILSYGTAMQLKSRIIEKGKDIFGDKFEYLNEVLKPKEYFVKLAEVDCLVYNQNRSQGVQGLFASLYFGTKCFVKSDICSFVNANDDFVVYDSYAIPDLSFAEFIKNDNIDPKPIFERLQKEAISDWERKLL